MFGRYLHIAYYRFLINTESLDFLSVTIRYTVASSLGQRVTFGILEHAHLALPLNPPMRL